MAKQIAIGVFLDSLESEQAKSVITVAYLTIGKTKWIYTEIPALVIYSPPKGDSLVLRKTPVLPDSA